MSINVCNDRSMASITSLPSGVSGSSLVLISEQTASSSSTIDFTSGIDSTYKEYIFKIINSHPATDNKSLMVNFRDGGSDFDATKTTTSFRSGHNESDSTTQLDYVTGYDLANSTGDQYLIEGLGNDADQTCCGIIHLFDPSNTTFVKHFLSNFQGSRYNEFSANWYVAGYCNVTAAIDGVRFKMDSGNIDSGTFKMYGVT